MPRTLLGLALILGLIHFGAAVGKPTQPPQAPAPRVVPIDELVRQLGSEDFAEREAAEKRLSTMAIDPPPEVLASIKS